MMWYAPKLASRHVPIFGSKWLALLGGIWYASTEGMVFPLAMAILRDVIYGPDSRKITSRLAQDKVSKEETPSLLINRG